MCGFLNLTITRQSFALIPRLRAAGALNPFDPCIARARRADEIRLAMVQAPPRAEEEPAGMEAIKGRVCITIGNVEI